MLQRAKGISESAWQCTVWHEAFFNPLRPDTYLGNTSEILRAILRRDPTSWGFQKCQCLLKSNISPSVAIRNKIQKVFLNSAWMPGCTGTQPDVPGLHRHCAGGFCARPVPWREMSPSRSRRIFGAGHPVPWEAGSREALKIFFFIHKHLSISLPSLKSDASPPLRWCVSLPWSLFSLFTTHRKGSDSLVMSLSEAEYGWYDDLISHNLRNGRKTTECYKMTYPLSRLSGQKCANTLPAWKIEMRTCCPGLNGLMKTFDLHKFSLICKNIWSCS